VLRSTDLLVGPVLTFFATAVAWLGMLTFFGLLAAIKLHAPDFLGDIPFLTYGRVWPAYMMTFIYGWASLTGMGVGIWLMARLCRVPIRYPSVLMLGALFWNVGLAMAVAAILGGLNTGIEGMEMPKSAALIMFIGYVFIGLWGALLYRFRNDAPSYVSVWYLLAAFFWFAWLFATAHILTSVPQLRGVMTSVVGAWYVHNSELLLVHRARLGGCLLLHSESINRPIYGYDLASIGFWTFILFSGLDLDGATERRPRPSVVGHGEYCGQYPPARADRHDHDELPHDHARALPHGLSQPDDAVYVLRRNRLRCR
jgi:cytochrome c oxidase cbb3-type subunit 1